MQQQFKFLFPVVCFIISISFTGCDSNRVYDSNQSLPEKNWDLNNKLIFKVAIDDTLSASNMYINVRNTGEYRFSNMFIFLTTKFPDGKLELDTLDLSLADDDGRWLGSGLGDLFYNQVLFNKKFRFPQKGQYTFELKHGMRLNPLPGVADVGVRIEKAK